MEIKEGRFKTFCRRYGVFTLACLFSVAIALAIAFNVEPNSVEPVSTQDEKFGLPMSNAVVVKDYADDHLQFNESLNRWEIHLAVDLASENDSVMSVLDGVVSSIECNSLDGCKITIEHAGGFVSVYSSLDENVNVEEGQAVKKGQVLGKASQSATNESKNGGHLHFELLKNGMEIDPNNYLDLQNK